MSENKKPTLFWRWIAIGFSIVGILVAFAIPKDPNNVSSDKTNMIAPPPLNPYPHAAAGAGIVEAFHEDIFLGNPVGALVEDIFVSVSDIVKKDQPLYTLDTRAIRAQLEVDKAKVEEARSQFLKAEDLYLRVLPLIGTGAVSNEEISIRTYDYEIAKGLLKSAEEQVQADLTQLQIHTIRAPKDGKILRHTIRKGDYLQQITGEEGPVIMMGDVNILQMRVDIDEQVAPRVIPGKPAVAYPKGLFRRKIPLKFLRIEPYVVPKKSLTGASDERVDTRVLQVLFTFEPPKDFPVYVGQQFDVFIEADPLPPYDLDVDNDATADASDVSDQKPVETMNA